MCGEAREEKPRYYHPIIVIDDDFTFTLNPLLFAFFWEIESLSLQHWAETSREKLLRNVVWKQSKDSQTVNFRKIFHSGKIHRQTKQIFSS